MLDRTGFSEWAFAMMPYGDPWRARRRICHEALTDVRKFDDHQYKYIHRFLSHLLEAPESFMEEADL